MEFSGGLKITGKAGAHGRPVLRRVRTPVLVTSRGHKTPPPKGLALPPYFIKIRPSDMAFIESKDHRRRFFLGDLSQVRKRPFSFSTVRLRRRSVTMLPSLLGWVTGSRAAAAAAAAAAALFVSFNNGLNSKRFLDHAGASVKVILLLLEVSLCFG